MPLSWHPTRWWILRMSECEKKEIDPVFSE